MTKTDSILEDRAHPLRKVLPRPTTVTKRAQSLSPTAPPRARGTPTTKKLGERRCQSLSPIKPPAKKLTQRPEERKTRALEQPCASVPTTLELATSEQNEEKTKELPQFIICKLTRALTSKKRDFIKLKKALFMQQNAVLELYASIRELEARIGSRGDEELNELRVVSVAEWPAHDLMLLVRDDIALPPCELSGILGPQVLHQLHSVLHAIPAEFHSLAMELMARRIDILNLLRGKLGVERMHTDWKTKNNGFDQETQTLHGEVIETVEVVKSKINYALELAKIPWLDRDSLVNKIDRLQKENLLLQNEYHATSKEKEKKVSESEPNPNQAILEELKKERAARESLKAVVATAENMLRVARARIAGLEREVADARLLHQSTLQKTKDMEMIIRKRESTYDARTKKMQEASKASEATAATLTQQRDALEHRVRELQQLVDQRERWFEERRTKDRVRADALQAKVAKQERDIETAGKRVEELQQVVKTLEEKHKVLHGHSAKLIEVEHQRCLEYLPSKENEPTIRETEMWNDLQATKLALTKAEEELKRSRADKDQFLNSLSRIAQSEGPDRLEEKMSMELLEKERTIANLKMVVYKFQENEKALQQNIIKYEKELAELKLEVNRLRNYDCYSKDVKFQDLQTEMVDLQMKVECLSRERSALMSAAASRALMLERHERATQLFADATRARREIAALIDGTSEPPPVDGAVFAEISRSLSSVCASAADTWSALHKERARVLRLERAVLSQSLQLEREERARARLEDRRAQLERGLDSNRPPEYTLGLDSEPTVVLKLPNSVRSILTKSGKIFERFI